MGELVELDVTTVEESVTVNVTEEGQVDIAVFAETGPAGPAGPAGPNSVTSATTSNGTAQLTVDYLEASDYVAATNQLACYGSFVVASAALSTTIRNDGITDDRTLSLPDRSGSVALTEDYTGGTATIDVLNATVQGTLTANHIHGNIAGSVYAHVRAGENLAKGDPVYISGSHGTGANLIAVVSKADASNAAKMPAVGVMDAAVSNNANGHMVITGTISDLDTNAYAVNSVLYVASGGGFTTTPPASNSQPVAIVERSNTNNGAVIVKVNGLASSGGNGASDANKLARFSSAGTLPIANIGDLGTNVATFLATPTSANLAAAVTGETGTGALVFANSPTFSGTPLIGTKIILSENGFQRAFLSSDYTIATTNTLNKIPSFSISVESGKTYKLEIMLKVTGVAGSTHNSTLVGSFNLTAANSSMMYRRAGFETESFVLGSTPFSGFGLFNSTGTSSQICFLDGIIKPTSSGVLEVVLYSSSATNSVTMLKGAYMEATLLD